MELNKLKDLLTDKLQEHGYELSSLNFVSTKEGKTLMLVVDRVSPINMEDIVDLSRILNSYLDEVDPFSEAYILDISSLGAEKPLDKNNLTQYVDRYVHVHLINPIDGENIYEGTLVLDEIDTLRLSFKVKTRTKFVDIPKSNISKIRLAVKF